MNSDETRTRILLVEDHEVTRLGLSFLLDNVDDFVVVGEAENGEQAMVKVAELLPDIIVMDVLMPVMDGIIATQNIKAAQANTRILILTASDSEESLFATLAAGADGYVRKNSPNEQLVMAIRAVSTGVAWLDPGIARVVLGSNRPIPVKAGHHTSSNNEFNLSGRECEILALLIDGMSNPEMAKNLFVSPETIKTHMRHIMEKLCVSDRTQAAVKAMRHGFVGVQLSG